MSDSGGYSLKALRSSANTVSENVFPDCYSGVFIEIIPKSRAPYGSLEYLVAQRKGFRLCTSNNNSSFRVSKP